MRKPAKAARAQEASVRRRSAPRRPPRGRRAVGLSRERIAEAALALVDSEGLEKLTARGLARALGCEAMSLYHHFEGMEQVLDAVADRLLGEVKLPPSPSPSGLAGTLRTLGVRYSAVARRHPRAFPVIAARRLRTPATLETLTAAVRLLGAHGLEPRAALRCVRILLAYLNGAGLAIAAWQLEPAPGVRGGMREAFEGAGIADGFDEAAVTADLEAGVDLLASRLATTEMPAEGRRRGKEPGTPP